LTEKRIKPIFLKYGNTTVHPSFDVMDLEPLLILLLCWYGYSCEIKVFPDFEPNYHLFEVHKDKGKQRWEIFAWALREILSKEGGIGKCNIAVRKKLAYYNWMCKRPGAIDPLDLDVPDLH